jgi:cation diffusion facilitator CzcD-associated flavoprotein CzcO
MYTLAILLKHGMSKSLSLTGPSILKYINEAADEYKVRNNIIYQQRALCYNFDTKEKLWTITIEKHLNSRRKFTPVSLSLAVAVIIIMLGYPRI